MTVPWWPGSLYRSLASAESHTHTVRSAEPAATRRPSRDHAQRNNCFSKLCCGHRRRERRGGGSVTTLGTAGAGGGRACSGAPLRQRTTAGAWTRAQRPARPTCASRCPFRRRGGGCRWATGPAPSPCPGAPPGCTAAPQTARPTPAPPCRSQGGAGPRATRRAHLDVVVNAGGVDAGRVRVGGDAQHLEAVGEGLHRVPHPGVPQLGRGDTAASGGAGAGPWEVWAAYPDGAVVRGAGHHGRALGGNGAAVDERLVPLQLLDALHALQRGQR